MPTSFHLLFSSVAALYAFQAAPSIAAPAAKFSVTSAKYCQGAPGIISPLPGPSLDAVVLLLNGRISFRNLGQIPLILPSIFDVVGVIAGGTLRQTRLQVFGVGTPPLDPELPKEINDPLDSRGWFLVVPAGKSVDDLALKRVEFLVYDPSWKSQPDVRGKKLSLQLELGMQRLSQRLAKDLGLKWKEYGYVWNLNFTTEPCELAIPAAPAISDCSHEFRID